jgi:hypothetical protein
MAKLDQKSAKAPPGQLKHDDHSFGTLDASSLTPTGNLIVGSGIPGTNFNITVDDKTDIELGLKIHYRNGPDIAPTSIDADGTANYNAPAGLQTPTRALWNFDFSVNTGIDGSTKTLDDFDFRIIVASGDGEVGVFDMQHVAPGNTPWLNSAGGGFTDDDGTTNTQLSQNSVNLGFAFMQAIFGADYANAGETYDITLQAFDHGMIVAQVQDHLVLV